MGDTPDRGRCRSAVHSGGRWASLRDTSTAIYTHVSGDFMNTALRKALGPAFDINPSHRPKESWMARKLDYRWYLPRQVMADRGMFATTDLIEPLAQRGIHLSSSQVYRLVVERPSG